MKIPRWLLISYIFSLLLRIPRFIGVYTVDGFYLIWEADLLIRGELFEVLLHPTSFLGMYPNSPYPIGSVLIMAFFRLISFQNLWITIILFNAVMILLSILTMKKFVNLFTDNPFLLFIGTLSYNAVPFFLQYSYTNVSARTPFLVLFPLILYFQSKAIIKRSTKDMGYALIIAVLANLFHRMAMVVLFQTIGATILLFLLRVSIIEKYWQKFVVDTKIRYIAAFLVAVALLSYLTSLVIANIFTYYTVPVNTGIEILNYYQVIISQLLQKVGTLVFLGFFGTLFMLFSDQGETLSDYNIVLFLQSPFLLLLPNVVYVSYLIVPLFLVLSIFGFQQVLSHEALFRNLILGLTLSLFLLIVLIAVVFSLNTIYLVIFILTSTVVGMGTLFIDRWNISGLDNLFTLQTFLIILLCLSNITILQANIDFSLTEVEESPGEVFTQEEQKLVDYLDQYNRSTLWGYSIQQTARVATQLQWYMLNDLHSITPIVIEFNSENIKNHTLKPIYQWSENLIYEPGLNTGRAIHSDLLLYNVTHPVLQTAITQWDIPFFIAYRDSTIAEPELGVWESSIFIESLQNRANSLFETKNYVIFDLRPFHLMSL